MLHHECVRNLCICLYSSRPIPHESRFRGILPATKDFTSNSLASSYGRLNPSFDMLFKEQEHLLKQANAHKPAASTRSQSNILDRFAAFNHRQPSPQIEITLSKGEVVVSKSQASPMSPPTKKSSADNAVQNLSLTMNDEDLPDDEDEITVVSISAEMTPWRHLVETYMGQISLIAGGLNRHGHRQPVRSTRSSASTADRF